MPNAGMGAITGGERFKGFESDDFDAYAPKKWASNAYTLARRRTKDKLIDLAKKVQDQLTEEIGTLELGASDEAPTVANGRKVDTQVVFFTRDQADRARLSKLLNRTDLQSGAGLFDIAIQHQHACLFLRVDHDGFYVGIEVAGKATVDRENIATKLGHDWAIEGLKKRMDALVPGTTIGASEKASSPLEVSRLESWVSELQSTEVTFSVEKAVPRTDASLAESSFSDEVIAMFRPLAELYGFMAWSPQNDYAEVKENIEKSRDSRASAFEAGERVTILSGLFAGRGGYLSEIDPKGKAKVMVGPVSVSVDLKDIKRAG